jgi:hypothetical protein
MMKHACNIVRCALRLWEEYALEKTNMNSIKSLWRHFRQSINDTRIQVS